jgi:hypothetical protein
MADLHVYGRRRRREQQALELNDTVLQGLVVAKMALELDHPQKAAEALAASIDSVSRIITGLMRSEHQPLDLLRSVPAVVGAPAREQVGPAGHVAPDGQRT